MLDSLIGDPLRGDFLLRGMKKIIGSVRNVGAENIGLRASGDTELMVQYGLNLNFHKVVNLINFL